MVFLPIFKGSRRRANPSTPLGAGFSLLELLIALACAAVLAAVLSPALAEARQRTRQTQCLSHLRQIGVAIHLYGADHRVYVPWNTAASDWSYLIKPYLDRGSNVVYGDPNSRSPVIVCPSRKVPVTNLQPTYGCHRQIMTVYTQSPGPLRYGAVKRPAETLLMADAMQSPGYVEPWGCYALAFSQAYDWTLLGDPSTAGAAIPTAPDSEVDGDNLRYRHQGSANVLFVDGHVASFAKGSLEERHVMVSY